MILQILALTLGLAGIVGFSLPRRSTAASPPKDLAVPNACADHADSPQNRGNSIRNLW